MIVINSKLHDLLGIIITCSMCGCEYVVEDRCDLLTEKKTILYPVRHKAIAYTTKCPECGCLRYLGVNPNEDEFHTENPYGYVFKRKDWNARFRVNDV